MRRAIGDDGARQRYVRTMARRGLRFIGEVRVNEAGAAPQSACSGEALSAAAFGLRESISFCRSRDGVRLAMASAGEGLTVVKTDRKRNQACMAATVFTITQNEGCMQLAIKAETYVSRRDAKAILAEDRELKTVFDSDPERRDALRKRAAVTA